MTTSMIDGTVEEAVTGRSRGGITVFKSIRFQLDDGSSHTVTITAKIRRSNVPPAIPAVVVHTATATLVINP